jgi:hypothetical protein
VRWAAPTTSMASFFNRTRLRLTRGDRRGAQEQDGHGRPSVAEQRRDVQCPPGC